MPIRLNYAIKITDDLLDWLGATLDVYLYHSDDGAVPVGHDRRPDTELELYRVCLARELEHRLTRKSHAMSHALQRECRLKFSVAEVVLVRTILLGQPYDRRNQAIIRLFDQAKVNLLPLHPT